MGVILATVHHLMVAWGRVRDSRPPRNEATLSCYGTAPKHENRLFRVAIFHEHIKRTFPNLLMS